MEVRDQEKEIGMPGSLGYNQPSREPSKVLRTRDEAGLDDTNIIFNNHQSQALDHHQFNLQQQQLRHKQVRDQNPDPDPAPSASRSSSNTSPIKYRECLKNHAAGMGGHVVDGCGEFMPGGEEGTAQALKCAACDCHRNFHRKEIEGESQYNSNPYIYSLHSNPNKNSSSRRTTNTVLPPPPHPSPFLNHHHKYNHGLLPSANHLAGSAQPMMMAFGGTAAESSSEDLNMFQSNAGIPGVHQSSLPTSKKRFRTKFSKEQKGKMMGFAEKLDWKIQKQDEQEVEQFCSAVGIKRQVFKVWMHNNKQAMKKKQQQLL